MKSGESHCTDELDEEKEEKEKKEEKDVMTSKILTTLTWQVGKKIIPAQPLSSQQSLSQFISALLHIRKLLLSETSFYTQHTLAQRSFYLQKLLHTASLYTEKL